MGLGIGKDCERCGDQLSYGIGFNSAETLCLSCEKIVRFDLKSAEEKETYLD